ncbi:unnamed protein product [Closterium sp. Naga37s-1]|nr:unnamed protein product [Closterium sp. Naga37s-1]
MRAITWPVFPFSRPSDCLLLVSTIAPLFGRAYAASDPSLQLSASLPSPLLYIGLLPPLLPLSPPSSPLVSSSRISLFTPPPPSVPPPLLSTPNTQPSYLPSCRLSVPPLRHPSVPHSVSLALSHILPQPTPARVTSLPSSSLVDALCSALASARSPQGMAQGRAQGNGGERAVREGGGQAVGLLLEELERRVQTGVGSGVEGLGLVRVRLEEQQSRSSVPSERGLTSERGGEGRRAGGQGVDEAAGGHEKSERRERREWGQLCARVLRAAAMAGNADVGQRVMHAMLSGGVPVAVGAQISFLRALCNAGRMHEALNWLEMRVQQRQQQGGSSRRLITAGRRGQAQHSHHHRSTASSSPFSPPPSPPPPPLSASLPASASASAAPSAVCAALCAGVFNVVLTACARGRDSRSAARCVLLMEQCAVPCDAISYTELIKLAGLVGDREAVEDLWKQLLHAMAAAHPHAPPPPPSPPTHSPRQPPSSPSSTLSPEPSPTTTTSTTTSSSPSAQHPHPYPSSPSPPSSPPAPPPLPLVALTARVVAFSRITGALSDALQAMGDMEAAVVRELQGGHGRIGSGCGLLLERASAVRLKSVRVGAGGKEGIGGIEERHGLSTAAEGAAGAVGAAAARVPEERSERSSDRRGRGMWEARGTWGCNREGAWDGKQLLALISQHEGHETEGVAAESRGESEGAALGGAGEGSGEEARGVSMNRDMGLGLGMGRGMELQGAKEGREWEAVEMGLRVGWNAILNAAAKHGRWDLALAMLQRMVQWGVRPDDYTINALTRAAFASHRPTLAQAIVIRPDQAFTRSDAAAAAVATSTASGEHATRLRFAGNALIRACSKEGRFDNALQVFKAMLADQVPVDTCTLQALLLLAAGPTTPTRWGIKGSGSGGGMGGGGDLVGDWMGVGDGWGGNEMGLRGVRGRRGGEGWGDGEGGAGELEGEAGMGRWKSGDHDHEDMDGETGVSAVGWRDDDAGAVDEEGEGGGTRQREVWQRVAAVEAAMGAAGVRHSAASFCTLSLNHRILLPPSCLFFPFQPAWQVRVLGGAGLCRAMQQHVQWGLSTPDAAGRPLTDTLTLNTAIAAAARLGQVHAARQLFALTEQHRHLTPTTVTFNALLNALAVAAAHPGAGSASARGSRRGGDVLVERDGRWRGGGEWEGEGGETDCVAEVCDVIEEMEERGVEPDTITFNTAIKDYKAAHRFLARMEQHPHLTPDQTSYSTAVAFAAFQVSAYGWLFTLSYSCAGVERLVDSTFPLLLLFLTTPLSPAIRSKIRPSTTLVPPFPPLTPTHRPLTPLIFLTHLSRCPHPHSPTLPTNQSQGNIFHMELFLARLLRQRVPLSFSALASVVEAYAHAIPRRINQVTPATLALAEHSQQVQWEQGGRLEGGQGESKAIEKAEVKRRGRGSAVVSGGEEKGGVAVRSGEGRLMEFAWQLAAEVETSGECEEEGGGVARRESVVGWRARIEEQLQQWERALE